MAKLRTKTDNHNLSAKLLLRRYFLRKYHAESPPNVFECCQGYGVMWSILKEEFTLATYWGVDLKPKPGRLKIDSVRILQQSGWNADVVDVDTYGSPWKHWAALLPNVAKPTTVFLTLGQLTTGTVGAVGKESLHAAGLKFPTLKLPPAFQVKLASIFPSYCLSKSCDKDIMIVEALEAVSDGRQNARYFGVRLVPKKNEAEASLPLPPPQPKRSKRHG